jgi:transposase InsO family protein
MVVIDRATKEGHFIPTHTTLNAEGATRLYLREVWKHHGLPRAVLSDQGPQFIVELMHEVYWQLGIKLAMPTAYHPQTDGQTEHINQELEGYLWNFMGHHQDDLDELLPLSKFVHNNYVCKGLLT